MTSALSLHFKRELLAVVTAVAVLGLAITGVRSEDHSPVINVPTGSAEMSAAIAKARATLPTFLGLL